MGDVVNMPSPPPGPTPIAEMIKCVDRELGMRARVYPRWVKHGKLSEVGAEAELRRMRAVRDRLVLGEAWHTVMTGLAERAGVDAVALQLLVRQAEAAARAIFPEPTP